MRAHDQTKLAAFGFSDPDKKEPDHELACAYLAQDAVARKLVSVVCPGHDATIAAVQAAQEEVEKVYKKDVFVEFMELTKAEEAHRNGRSHDWSTELFTKWYNEEDALRKKKIEWAVSKGLTERRIKLPTGGVEFSEGVQTRTEAHIVKGRGEYAASIGWADVLIDAQAFFKCVGVVLEVSKGGDFTANRWESRTIHSEVRIGVEVKIGKVPISDALRQITFYGSYLNRTAWMLVAPWDITDVEREFLARSKVYFIKLGPGFDEFKRAKAGRVVKSLEI